MPRRWLACCVLLISAWTAYAAVASEIHLRHDLVYLASDRLAGRMTGEEGGRLAADYIAARYGEIGLAPLCRDGYYQPFDVVVGREVERGAVRWGGRNFEVGREALVAPFSPTASVTAPVVFAGYGLPASDEVPDDYAGLDVRGKVALVLSGYHRPPGGDPVMDTFARARRKASFAAQSGAVAVLYIRCGSDSSGDDLPSFAGEGVRSQASIPLVGLTRAAALRVLPPDYAGVLAEATGAVEAHRGDALGEVTLQTDVRAVTRRAANVVGLLPGSDPRLRWEYVVVGAHYDHIGLGVSSSMDPLAGKVVHNGADDNASGTAGLLAIAEALSSASPRPRRSVIFVCFAGEELGLLGSSHYVTHPPIPLADTVAMVNLDMVGRLRDRRFWAFGAATSPDFGPALASAAGGADGLDLQVSESAPAGSDHTSFVQKGVPSVFFFTGIHGEYHTSRDDWQLINFGGEESVLSVAESFIRSVADAPARPRFETPQAVPPSHPEEGRAGVRVTLGTMPDFAAMDQPGYHVGGVTPGGPADVAGLKGGDVVVRFGDDGIGDIEDFMAALMKRRPGDRVELVVERGTDVLRLMATLGERKVAE